MDKDPRLWTPEEVQHFWQHDAASLLANDARRTLPDLKPFLNMLHEDETNGEDLLKFIALENLQHIYGMRQIKAHAAILLRIELLRQKSATFQTPAPMPALNDSTTSVVQHAKRPLSPIPSPVLTHVAPADATVNVSNADDYSLTEPQKKKRKVALLNTAPLRHERQAEPTAKDTARTTASAATTEAEVETVSVTPKVAINDVFFSNTQSGKEIMQQEIDGLTPDSEHDDLRNFTFYEPRVALNEARFVQRRFKYFLRGGLELRMNDFKGQQAVAIIPYPRQLSKLPSAMVYRNDSRGNCIATRESVVDTANGFTITDQEPLSSNDPLAQLWHRYGDGDGEVLDWDNNDNNDTFSIITEETFNASDMAEEETESRTMISEEVESVIRAKISSFITAWHDTQPEKLERTQARKVWNTMKNSKHIQKGLIELAEQHRRQLEVRLGKLRENMLEGSFADEAEVQVYCDSLQPTVEDIEYQKWKISVLQRTERPQAQQAKSRSSTQGRRDTIVAGNTGRADVFHLGPIDAEDRLRNDATSQTAEPEESSDIVLEDVDAGAELEQVTESAAEAGEIILEDGETNSEPAPIAQSKDHPMSDFIVNDDEKSDYAPLAAPRSRRAPRQSLIVKLSIPSMRDTQDVDPVSDAESPSARKVAPSLVVKLPLRAQSTEMDRVVSDGTDASTSLPDPDSLFVKIEKSAKTPIIQNGTNEIIDLLSDSDEELSRQQSSDEQIIIKKEPSLLSAEEILANRHKEAAAKEEGRITAMDIENLNADMLAEDKEFKKLLMKMLYDAGPEVRNRIFDLRPLPNPDFIQRLKVALEALRDVGTSALKTTGGDSHTMLVCALLCSAWYSLRPAIFYNEDVRKEELEGILGNAVQMDRFIRLLQGLAGRKTSRMFNKPTHGHSRETALLLDSDSDDKKKQKRRREIKASEAAIQSRSAALDRQTKFDTSMQNSGSNAQVLAAMIESSPSEVHVDINPARDADTPAIFINDHIARSLKPHQIDGIRFMWRETTAEDEGVQGCLLAHSMGLGKTLQSIATLLTINETARADSDEIATQLPQRLRLAEVRAKKRHLRSMVLCPASLINNWRVEIARWVPNHGLGEVIVLDSKVKSFDRLHLFKLWKVNGGVLVIGYELFRSLYAKERGAETEDPTLLVPDQVAREISKILLETAEMVVADEAHALKNNKSVTSRAASRLHARTRIALTGTPLSNDMDEVFALISWVAPGYLGDQSWFNAHFAKPIRDGLYEDSSHVQQRTMKKKLAVLKSELEPKQLRADITVLKGTLKPKIEFILTVAPTAQQTSAYQRFARVVRDRSATGNVTNVNIFAWLSVLTLLLNHPSVFRTKLLEPPKPNTKTTKKRRVSNAALESGDSEGNISPIGIDNEVDLGGADDLDLHACGLSREKLQEIIGDIDNRVDSSLSAKTSLFMKLLKKIIAAREKTLVFSTTLGTLNHLARTLGDAGVRFGRIDGEVSVERRFEQIQEMTNGSLDVLIISTRAGSLGLNMQCASRIFIFDSGFNPTWEQQAVGRSYRLGQDKPVFVYRFVTGGTFEDHLENKQLFKTAMAARVVDKKKPINLAKRDIESWLHDPRPVATTPITEWIGKDPRVLDIVLKTQADAVDASSPNIIRAIRTMETLTADANEADLDAAEILEVQEEIKISKENRRRSARLIANAAPRVPASLVPPTLGSQFVATQNGQSASQSLPRKTSSSPARPVSASQRPDTAGPAKQPMLSTAPQADSSSQVVSPSKRQNRVPQSPSRPSQQTDGQRMSQSPSKVPSAPPSASA